MTKKAASKNMLWQKKMQSLSEEVLRMLRKKNVWVEVMIAPDKEMRVLEKRYMKKEKKIVDVLSFAHPKDFPQPEGRRKSLGEVYLNGELYAGDFERLSFLLIHGILHLLGYDHERRRDIMEMELLEARLHGRIMKLQSAKKK